jgi:hypothetical protein
MKDQFDKPPPEAGLEQKLDVLIAEIRAFRRAYCAVHSLRFEETDPLRRQDQVRETLGRNGPR